MTTAKRQNPQRFAPQTGEVYENAGGGQYVCTRSHDNSIDAWFMNTASGWELLAHGLIQYEDGTIEWDWSTDGRFSDGQLQKYRELMNCRKNAQTAQIWHRQMSLANAMLCFMI